MKTHKIAVIAGDGIGKEVMPEGLRALEATAKRFGIGLEFTTFEWADCDYYLKHGKHFRPRDYWVGNAISALDAIESRKATMFIGVPAMYRMMLEAGAEMRDLSSVRLWASGADAMPFELAKKFQRFGATARVPIVATVAAGSFDTAQGPMSRGRSDRSDPGMPTNR